MSTRTAWTNFVSPDALPGLSTYFGLLELVLVGGPVRNSLWNWITERITGTETLITSFSDASVVRAALQGHASLHSRFERPSAISARLRHLSDICGKCEGIGPRRIVPPDMGIPC